MADRKDSKPPRDERAAPASSPQGARGRRAGLSDSQPEPLPGQLSFLDVGITAGAGVPGQSPGTAAPKGSRPAKPEAYPHAKRKAYPHAGHRSRARERLSAAGPEKLDDYELMELLLTLAIPRRDTKALAKHLLATFGSFAAVLSAPRERLQEVDGVGGAVVSQFRILHAVAQRLARSQVMNRKPLSSWTDVIEYLRIAQGHELTEQFRILFFDKKNVLIADEVQGKGTVDHTPVYVREVVKRTLELSASAIILVHNHPSGDATPSRADIDMTRMIVEAARIIGVTVHDHIIVGRNGHASLKALKHL